MTALNSPASGALPQDGWHDPALPPHGLLPFSFVGVSEHAREAAREYAEIYARAALASREASPAPLADPDSEDAEGNHIGVVAGFARHKYRQGTRQCIAFVNGARWWNEVAALASPQVAPAPEVSVEEIQRLAKVGYEAGRACLIPSMQGKSWDEVGVTTALVWMNAVEAMLKVAAPAPVAPTPAAPEGWKLVPLAPTAEMAKAAADAWLDCGSRLILNRAGSALEAGIAAAKVAPTPAQPSEYEQFLPLTDEQGFTKMEAGPDGFCEWVCPDPAKYLMKCCDCGLVHEAQFRVAKYQPKPSGEYEVIHDEDTQAQFRMRRHTSGQPAQPSLDDDERAHLGETLAELESDGQTTTDYETLIDWAGRGFLRCKYFEITPEGWAATLPSEPEGESGHD